MLSVLGLLDVLFNMAVQLTAVQDLFEIIINDILDVLRLRWVFQISSQLLCILNFFINLIKLFEQLVLVDAQLLKEFLVPLDSQPLHQALIECILAG